MKKLNLGCSDQRVEGFVGVDSFTPKWATPENFEKADLRHSWPWDDGSIDFIRAHDIIEHMPDKIHTMNEIHRVLKPGGTVEIVVPTTDGGGAWQDPTHVSFWNRNSFLYHTFGDPHFNRFHEAYGVKGAFRVKSEQVEKFSDGVVKLHITLEAVKVSVIENRPVFSILHTSARPDGWRGVYNAWLCEAVQSLSPSKFEYILVCDRRWGFTELPKMDRPEDKAIWNTGRRCYVDGVNTAAAASTGQILIVNADDQFPCEKWDDEIRFQRDHSAAFHAGCPDELKGDWALSVSTGTPTEHEREIMVMPILSRTRYEKYGYVFYPQYESMFADNDLFALAERDGCIVDARHLIFPHKHWLNKQREMDEADKAQNRPEAYQLGEAIFKARKESNFADVKVEVQATRPIVIACTPGDMFSMAWMVGWTQLSLHIAGKYNLLHLAAYSSDVGTTRTEMMKAILDSDNASYVFWIDDDNVITPAQFEMLKDDLDSHPELDAVVAWCWCGPNEQPSNGIDAVMSCGSLRDVELTPDGKDIKYCCGAPLNPRKMAAAKSDLIEIGYSGFPAVLMRPELLKKAGKFPFAPMLDDRCQWGKSGEDLSFFAKAWARSGARFAMDRRIELPHYKRRPTMPTRNPFELIAEESSEQKETVGTSQSGL